jgi:Tfp pilus assembly protein PilF
MQAIRPPLLASGLLSLAGLIPPAAFAQSCDPWTARVISVQGEVRITRATAGSALAARLDDILCVGDRILVGGFSRAALVFQDETVVRLDQNTTVTLQTPQDEKKSWLQVLKGILHIISRDPRAITITTPFANAGIEGTEFLVEVTSAQAAVTVFEGRVTVVGSAESATATSGQQVIATAAQLSTAPITVRPPNAVVWALYYPPVLGGAALPAADAEPQASQAQDARFFTGRAAQRLAVGRVAEAQADLEQSLRFEPENAEALALQSIIATTQNDKDAARNLARQAVARAPNSAAALTALSYSQQAEFDLAAALQSMQQAVDSEPDNALAWARLSELQLSVGDRDQAIESAQRATELNPNLARTQTVRGFADLAEVRTTEARQAFNAAIVADSAAPLPRLGLGLAMIREGDLEGGREQIENAVILDPGNSLIRSYMGKAYYEEKRDTLAETQLGIAKELDPLDPTPYFYDAIRKQTINRPVEALDDLQRSIENNDNRSVYRSQLQLDQDLAARSASVGRIYRDLGFEELALREGWKSVATDPGDYSGHRLLADSYSSLPRHEIARVNELLQSQLMQPLNITPVQPQLAESNLFILDTAGPADISFNEFNPLFNRNRFAVQGSAVAGGNDTWGEDATVSGIHDRWSFSLGQYHFETDGFRENNNLDQDVFNGLLQYQPTETTSLLAELRATDRDAGDLTLRFDPQNYNPLLRQGEEAESGRLGVRHELSPQSTILAVGTYQDASTEASVGPAFSVTGDVEGYTLELQHLYQGDGWRLTSGTRYSERDQDELAVFAIPIPVPPFVIEGSEATSLRVDNLSAYLYGGLDLPAQNLSLTLGASADFLDGRTVEVDRVNPKAGLIWEPADGTTVRASVFRTLQGPSYSRQDIQPSLEPTPVAGFNQFFAGVEGEEVWRTGLGVDQRISDRLYVGAEASRRDLDIPFVAVAPPPVGLQSKVASARQYSGIGYLNWAMASQWALSANYEYDKIENDPEFDPQGFINLETHRIPVRLSWFHPRGPAAGLVVSYVDQRGRFQDQTVPFYATFTDNDEFWVLDAFVGYRLPKRYGVIRLEVRNLLDEDFMFQDVDPENPRIVPERFLALKLTIAL